MTLNDKNMQKYAKNFSCEKCDYICSTKYLLNQHFSTRKHKMMTNDDKNMPKYANKFICECGKEYKYRQGLHAHKKKCKHVEEKLQLQDINKNGITNEMFLTLMKQNTEIVKENCKLQTAIHEMVPKIGNNKTINNTNNFNINIFLNETCKDALNITEFVESLKLQIDDLMYSKQNGAIEGLSNILLKGLNDLEVEKRPVHCTDIKRETLYIKDNDSWEKEDKDKEKMKKAIFATQKRQAKLIQKWQEENPDWCDTPEMMEEFHQFVQNVHLNDGCENKIIKNIAKGVHIDKST